MEAISLKKVTAVVFIFIMGSYLANASDAIVEAQVIKTEVSNSDKSNSDKILKSFSLLVKKYDLDKNGLLSEAEVKVSQSEKLQHHFAEIDVNTDASISEVEFNQYISQVK